VELMREGGAQGRSQRQKNDGQLSHPW
jgi:hypothetical protein